MNKAELVGEMVLIACELGASVRVVSGADHVAIEASYFHDGKRFVQARYLGARELNGMVHHSCILDPWRLEVERLRADVEAMP